MADEEVELDYEEDRDDVKEVKEELPDRYKKSNAVPSVFSRIEGLKGKGDAERQETQSRRGIFTSGRLSGLKAPRRADDSSEKHNDDEARESSDDSDTETGEFFEGTEHKTDAVFSIPITRDGVKADLGLTDRQLRNAIKVYGTKDIEPYNILKVFSDYGADRWNEIDENSCLVQFQSRKAALKMLVEMSLGLTTLKNRFVEHENKESKVDDDAMDTTNHEDGEVTSDDEDNDGEVTESGARNSCYTIGNDVCVTDHVAYINLRKHSVPEQKWRVVKKHVPGGRILLVNFATRKERTLAEDQANFIVLPGKNVDPNGLEYSWQGDKVRPGLNIYDNEGKELEWDYGHDTRFYKEGETENPKEKEEEKEWEKPPLQVGMKGAIKVRGRGAKRFLGEDSDTLNSDKNVSKAKKERKGNDSDDWRFEPPSDKPTRRLD